MLKGKICPTCESHLNRKCPDSYLEMSLLQIKRHFYCTVIHLYLLLSQYVSAQLMLMVKLTIELNLEDAYRQNNERCRSIAPCFSLWDTGQNTQGARLHRVAKPGFTSRVAGHMSGSVCRSKLNGSFHLLRGPR